MNNKTILPELKSGQIFQIKAKPNSSKYLIEWDKEKNKFNIFLHSIPEDNKANEELIKLFKKHLKTKIEIISGFKGKDKKIKIL